MISAVALPRVLQKCASLARQVLSSTTDMATHQCTKITCQAA